MPHKLKRKCNQWGCFELTVKSYCPKHEKPRRYWSDQKEETKRDSSGRKIYDSKWRKFRKSYLARPENALCKECKRQGQITEASEIDHITPIITAPHLKYELTNLQPLCKSCHSRKTSYEVNARLNKRKQKPLVDLNPED